MNLQRTLWRHATAIMMVILLVMASSTAQAVVKNISVVGTNGQAIANTTVTIVFPDGTEKEEDTDSEGILIFDFPGDGNYQIVYPGGSMTVVVGGGMQTIELIAAGAFLAVAGLAVGLSQGIKSGGKNGNESGGSGGSGIPGTYNASTSVTSNPGGHPDNFGTASFIVTESGGTVFITISGSNISASLSGSLSGNSINMSSSGNYAGFSGVPIQITATFNPAAGTWSGTMTAGGSGLPGGQAIVVSFTGSHP